MTPKNTAQRILKISETKDFHDIDALVDRWTARMRRWWFDEHGNETLRGRAAYSIMHMLKLARDRSAYLEMRGEKNARIAELRKQEILECYGRLLEKHTTPSL